MEKGKLKVIHEREILVNNAKNMPKISKEDLIKIVKANNNSKQLNTM